MCCPHLPSSGHCWGGGLFYEAVMQVGNINNTLNHYLARREQSLCLGASQIATVITLLVHLFSLSQNLELSDGLLEPVHSPWQAIPSEYWMECSVSGWRRCVLSPPCLSSHCPLHLECLPSPLSFLTTSPDPSDLSPSITSSREYSAPSRSTSTSLWMCASLWTCFKLLSLTFVIYKRREYIGTYLIKLMRMRPL